MPLLKLLIALMISTRVRYVFYAASKDGKINPVNGFKFTPVAMPDTPPQLATDTRITPGAQRMRESRRRRREGLRCITLDLRATEIDRLIELGHLHQDERNDKNAVLLALYLFLDASALGGAHR